MIAFACQGNEVSLHRVPPSCDATPCSRSQLVWATDAAKSSHVATTIACRRRTEASETADGRRKT
jgi:hypothetical protein